MPTRGGKYRAPEFPIGPNGTCHIGWHSRCAQQVVGTVPYALSASDLWALLPGYIIGCWELREVLLATRIMLTTRDTWLVPWR